ncbi:uncharacterized protein LOC112521811 [Cynara cardunculus var. scolymus]|uniref:uncharacterized protein LOC112521811 n=1 Tax=Cynara cardunculus var. scolymus TaxID=59895 RepID=UPI000D62E974|nr:uncharacterized protein LOC112521811 [Cynara cardunculus var. scolymus]
MSNKVDPKPLHPVYTVTNIQHKVRVLDGVKVSYSSWVKLFMLHAKGYDVLQHIDGFSAPAKTSTDYPSWEKIVAVVLQWIYGTLSDDLLVRVLVDDSTAFEAWQRVKNLFVNNKGSRAQALQHELTNLTLAAMPSIEAYCQRIRDLSDQLAAVDCPLNDNQLVLYLVRGLPREYDTIASILNQTLPSWEDAIDRLQSEARRIAAREAAAPTPLVAAAVTSPPTKRDAQDNSTYSNRENQNRLPSGSRRDSSKNGRSNTSNRGPGQYSQRPTIQQPFYPPPPYWAPPYWAPPYWAPPPCPYPTQSWTQPWQHRINPRPSSNLPSNRTAQAHLADVDPLQPTQLADVVHALSMEPSDEQWYFDTGASSHLTYDQAKWQIRAHDSSLKRNHVYFTHSCFSTILLLG